MFLAFTLLALLPGEAVMRVYIARLTQMPKSRPYIIYSCLIGLTGWVLANRVFSPAVGIPVNLVTGALLFVLTWKFAPGQYKGRSILLAASFYLVQMVCCQIVFLLFLHLGLSFEQTIDPTAPLFPVMVLLATLLQLVTIPLLSFLIQRYIDFAAEGRFRFWLIALPILQFAAILILYLFRYVAGMQDSFSTAFSVCVSVVLLSDLLYLLVHRKYLFSKEAELKLQQAESQLQAQTTYFEQMQNNMLQVNQLRHDLNNQLQAAYYLLEKGESDAVRSQLDLLKHSIADRVGPRFCSNLMVDAVLSEKADLCRQSGVQLEVSVALPREINIPNAHLCSIYSNLLDNAIHGVLAQEDRTTPIRLQTDVQQGFLMIRCENPAHLPQNRRNDDPMRQHGLGLTILQQLAERYSGQLRTSCQDGLFKAELMLNLNGNVQK